jgi:hypothetical protein
MFLTAMTQTAGITNTKSGTWIRSFFQRLNPDDSTKAGAKRTAELRRLGFLDGNTPTWEVKGADGKVDWMASLPVLAHKMQAWLASMPDAERLNKLKFLFGERGAGFGALMNLPQLLEKKMNAFQGGDDVLSDLARLSPLQQFKKTWADLTNVLMDLGQVALPPVVGGLQAIDATLKSLKSYIPQAGSFGGPPLPGTWNDNAAKKMGAGAAAGAIIGFPFGGVAGSATGAAVGGVGGWIFGALQHLFGFDKQVDATGKAANAAADGVRNLTGAINGLTGATGGGALKKMNYLSPPGGGGHVLHAHLYLGGAGAEKIADVVTRVQVAKATYPNAIGGVDTYGSWTSPGTGLIDAA